jgi:SecD/SecF fusion protein
MNNKRRNFLVLLLVAGLLCASLAVIFTKPTRLGLDLKGGVSLVYQALPTKQSKVTGEAIDRSIEIMRDRVDKLGVAEPEILRSGEDQIIVNLPDVQNVTQAENQVGTVAQLFFYDWEPNVIGPDGKPDPTNQAVTGGPSAGTQGGLSQYDAVQRAAKQPKVVRPNASAPNGSYYLTATKPVTVTLASGKPKHYPAKSVLAGPEDTPAGLYTNFKPDNKQPAGTNVVFVKPGTIVLQGSPTGTDGQTPSTMYFVLQDNPVLKGTDITDPKQSFDSGPGQGNAPNVTFGFTDKAQGIWEKVTKEIAHRGEDNTVPGTPANQNFQHFAIALDNALISTPYIDFTQNSDGIDASNGSEISGGFTIKSAQNLANLLQTGALPIKLKRISSSQVSATLGKEALHAGLIAGAVGFLLVAFFLLLFYRVLGVIAVAALIVYSIYLFALIKLIPITMTLPGIAGLVLTIGVAADANIVIFERVKEEIRNGRSVSAGIATGYKKGIAAIVDANVVTIMVAFILFILATAGVKGFALTLGVGTITSLFTAVVATQAVLGTLGNSRIISSPSALGAKPDAKQRWQFDFMGNSKWFFAFSGVILAIGALAIGGKGLNFGIDFKSGTQVKVALTKPATVQGVRDAISGVSGVNAGEAEIQSETSQELGKNAFSISTKTLEAPQSAAVVSKLNAKYGVPAGKSSVTTIGPTFGQSVAESAIIAIIASLIVISAYIALRFEWKYAVPVFIALMHDLLITAGVYSITGYEVTTSTVAALLTILGFSLYDTIIVFDRVRENVPRMPRAAFSQIVNRSMSEVLTRSLATSACTLIPVLALLFLGGDTLKDFAFALTVGVLSGAYSSIFIASPVLTHSKEREPSYRRRAKMIADANDGVVPAFAEAKPGEAPVDVPVKPKAPRGRLTAPEDPDRGVSKAEFDAMVADLHAEPGAKTATEIDPTADASPDEVFLKDEATKKPKSKGPRNRKHGRR